MRKGSLPEACLAELLFFIYRSFYQNKLFEFDRKIIKPLKKIHLHNAQAHGKAHFGLQKQGNLDTKDFLYFLEKIGYTKFVRLEVVGQDDIRESWQFLRSLD